MNNLVRNIILAAIVLVVALVLWLIVLPNFQDEPQSMSKTTMHVHKDQSAAMTKTAKEMKQETMQQETMQKEKMVKEPEKIENAAAKGLSRFYANLYGDESGDGPVIRNNIVYLPDPKGDIEEILKARERNNEPLRPSWEGNTKTHPFRKGETLFDKLSEYAKESNIEIIWWINRDLVVKDTFRINENIMTTAYQIGRAIEGHFENGLRVYFCHKQSAIVFISKSNSYVKKECLLLPRR